MPLTSTIENIYTDGACINNPGPGGWGVVIYFTDGSRIEMGESEEQTTNNRMELQATIAALKFFASSGQNQPIIVHTDSEYVKKGITQWINGWKKKGWKTSTGKPVSNQDLWQILDQLNNHWVKWQHVKGHSGNEGNERCDAIANAFARGYTPSLIQSFPINKVDGDWQPAKTARQSLNTDNHTQVDKTAVTELSDVNDHSKIIKQDHNSSFNFDQTMSDQNSAMEEQQLPREVRVAQLNNLIDTLRIAEEIASQGYLISSSELADLMDINASAVTSRGDHWSWRNWVVSRVRREGNQILWQLERVD